MSRDFSRFFFSRSSYDTLALHALVDDTIEKTTAVVTEGGAVVGVLLEMVLRPRVLRYYTITPCTHTQPLGLDDDDDNGGDGEKGETERGGTRDCKERITRSKRMHRRTWIVGFPSRGFPVTRAIPRVSVRETTFDLTTK